MEWFQLSSMELQALQLSLKVGAASLLITLPVAILLAWLLARHDFPGKSIVNGLVHLPLVLPPVVTGFILLLLLGTQGPVGGWLQRHFDIVVAFRWTGAAIAAAIVSLPLAVGAIRLSLELVDQRLEQAAATLGAPPIWVFITITLPLMLPGIITGAILALARALGEFGATITFVANIPGETRTLPLAIYSLTQVPGQEFVALRLLVISASIAFAALLASEWLNRHLQRRLLGI